MELYPVSVVDRIGIRRGEQLTVPGVRRGDTGILRLVATFSNVRTVGAASITDLSRRKIIDRFAFREVRPSVRTSMTLGDLHFWIYARLCDLGHYGPDASRFREDDWDVDWEVLCADGETVINSNRVLREMIDEAFDNGDPIELPVPSKPVVEDDDDWETSQVQQPTPSPPVDLPPLPRFAVLEIRINVRIGTARPIEKVPPPAVNAPVAATRSSNSVSEPPKETKLTSANLTANCHQLLKPRSYTLRELIDCERPTNPETWCLENVLVRSVALAQPNGHLHMELSDSLTHDGVHNPETFISCVCFDQTFSKNLSARLSVGHRLALRRVICEEKRSSDWHYKRNMHPRKLILYGTSIVDIREEKVDLLNRPPPPPRNTCIDINEVAREQWQQRREMTRRIVEKEKKEKESVRQLYPHHPDQEKALMEHLAASRAPPPAVLYSTSGKKRTVIRRTGPCGSGPPATGTVRPTVALSSTPKPVPVYENYENRAVDITKRDRDLQEFGEREEEAALSRLRRLISRNQIESRCMLCGYHHVEDIDSIIGFVNQHIIPKVKNRMSSISKANVVKAFLDRSHKAPAKIPRFFTKSVFVNPVNKKAYRVHARCAHITTDYQKDKCSIPEVVNFGHYDRCCFCEQFVFSPVRCYHPQCQQTFCILCTLFSGHVTLGDRDPWVPEASCPLHNYPRNRPPKYKLVDYIPSGCVDATLIEKSQLRDPDDEEEVDEAVALPVPIPKDANAGAWGLLREEKKKALTESTSTTVNAQPATGRGKQEEATPGTRVSTTSEKSNNGNGFGLQEGDEELLGLPTSGVNRSAKPRIPLPAADDDDEGEDDILLLGS